MEPDDANPDYDGDEFSYYRMDSGVIGRRFDSSSPPAPAGLEPSRPPVSRAGKARVFVHGGPRSPAEILKGPEGESVVTDRIYIVGVVGQGETVVCIFRAEIRYLVVARDTGNDHRT